MVDSWKGRTPLPALSAPSAASTIGPEIRPEVLQEMISTALAVAAEAPMGTVSQHIPRLSTVSPHALAIAACTVDGHTVMAGDAEVPLSLQSVTKLFALCALLTFDDEVWHQVGWGPSAAGYASVAELENHQGQPRNPFVNSGALVVTDLLLGYTGNAAATTRDLIASCGDSPLPRIDSEVAASEARADHRNAAIAHVLAAHHRLSHPVEEVLQHYFSQCAIETSTVDLAKAGLFLAQRGALGPLDQTSVRRVNAALLTSGMYGASGDIAHRIGLPAKSGIGGGVLAVLPGVGTVAVWSPGLTADGNSSRGVAALEEFARLAGWSVF